MEAPIMIGIDLGTTNSCMATLIENRIDIIPSELGNKSMPSVVSFDDNVRLIGEGAKEEIHSNFQNTICNIKRLMGYKSKRNINKQVIDGLMYNVVDREEEIFIEVEYQKEKRYYKPEQISAMILEKMKSRAEEYIGAKVQNAFITVPAYFNARQREATRNAGIISGLNVIKLISEPTAAAIGFFHNRKFQEETKIFVFDFGGGTFDASVLSVINGNFNVLATGGDTNLGGEDINNLLVEYCISEFEKLHKMDSSITPLNMFHLKSSCENAKKFLSMSPRAKIKIPFLFEDKDLLISITRPKFEDICRGVFNRTISISKSVLDEAGLQTGSINEILMIGGSTRIPKIRAMIQDLFKKAPSSSVNPDEAVAFGAAVYASKYTSDIEFKLRDVLPISIGTGVKGGKIFKNINRNTQIPTKITNKFTTREDYQTKLCFRIYEGDKIFSKNNTLLGSFTIEGIPPAKRGKMGADVTMEIDENGIIKVNAVTANGLEGSISISDSSIFGLSPREISKLHKEAEELRYKELSEERRISAMLDLEDYAYELRDLAESKEYSESSTQTLMTLFQSSIELVQENSSKTEKIYQETKNMLKNMVQKLK